MQKLEAQRWVIARLIDYIATAVIAAVALVAFLTFRDYGLGWDDYTHSQYGQLLLDYYRSGLSDKRALSFVNLYMYGGGFDMAAALLDRITPFDLFETRRFFGAIVGIIGLAVTWRLARRLGGPEFGAWAGLAAVLLLATCPQYYGHMFINPKDAPFAVAMAGAPARACARAVRISEAFRCDGRDFRRWAWVLRSARASSPAWPRSTCSCRWP